MPKAKQIKFKAELKQLMDIFIHSLYTQKEFFLRELISNASDAIDTLRFDALTDEKLRQEQSEWKIKIIPDEKAGTLTISDNGIGMDRQEIIVNLGTVAKSGTRELVEKLKNAESRQQLELIGQFGVGFYASFMVADKVTVISRRAGRTEEDAVEWTSDGQGAFSVVSARRESAGTDVILHLRKQDRDYLQPGRISQIVRKFSDFIEHPVVMDTEKGEGDEKELVEEVLNTRQAIWLRPKSEITDSEHSEFYKHVSRNFDDPAKVIHYSAEGTLEFKALLYIPKQRLMDFLSPSLESKLQLYVKRVFITEECENLLLPYLRFVKGVVDCPDLPLNVSREMVQQNPLIEKIQKNLVKKVLGTLKQMMDKQYEDYVKFFTEFGEMLKEGVYTDLANRETLADLLLFESTGTEPGKYVSLKKYVENMPEDQKEIYYLWGETRAELENSPYLEVFRSRGQDVLLMTDPIDEWAVQGLAQYKGKNLKAVDKGELEEDKQEKQTRQTEEKKYKGLLEFLDSEIEEVSQVRLSGRLTESASCLVAQESGMGAQMERLMKKMGRTDGLPESRRILELNAPHPAVKALNERYEADSGDPRVVEYARLLFDQAVIAEGSKVKDPAAFARRINELMVKDAAEKK
ncbi:MAG: molecular chaperone HtpG [Gemmatimonadota bacterium]|nr:molecular chaperone HtpG [Gemmatimonadota bacterium]